MGPDSGGIEAAERTGIMIAAQPGTLGFGIAGCALMLSAVFVLARTIRNTLYSEDAEQGDEWRYDINRINELRQLSVLYRLFYPMIAGLAVLNRGLFRESLPEIGRELQAAGHSRFWTPEMKDSESIFPSSYQEEPKKSNDTETVLDQRPRDRHKPSSHHLKRQTLQRWIQEELREMEWGHR